MRKIRLGFLQIALGRTLVLLICVFVALQASSQNIDSLINSIRAKRKIPMVAVAVVSADSVLYMKAFGSRKLEDVNPNATVNDYMHIASNAKAMSGFIAGTLVEKGKISWETRFFDLFPQWKSKANPAFHGMTLQDLLSHRSRIPPYTKLESLDSAWKALQHIKGNASKRRKAFVEALIQGPAVVPEEKNGTVYSNAAYSVAALMLEKVTGKTWEKLMQNVFQKDLGLGLSFNYPQKINAAQPWGYSDSLQAISFEKAKATINDYDFIEPSGESISMPFQDYVKFVQLNLKGLQREGQYLQKSTYHFLHFGLPEEAIGWANGTMNGVKISNHTGSAGYFFAGVMIIPERDRSYIVIINKGDKKGALEIAQLLMKRIK